MRKLHIFFMSHVGWWW